MKLRDLVYLLLPKPFARNRLADAGRQVTRLLVLTNDRNPTFTYYLEERLARSALKVDVRSLTARLDDIDPDGLAVILCRYVRPLQLLWLYRNRKRLAAASLLIDDDVAATVTAKQGSGLYKLYLAAIGIAPLPILNRILTEVWVSTPALASALSASGSSAKVVLPPFPPAEAFTPLAPDHADEDRLVMAFHATGSHDGEHAFLVPIVREALERCGKLHFEVVAEGRPARLWTEAGLPAGRFTLSPKRDWNLYLAETARQRTDILLVPLLRSKVNDVRSSTKRCDVARMGAAAVFSLCPAYERDADPDEILIENDIRTWVGTICRLAEDGDLRRRTRGATVNAVRMLLTNTTARLPMTSDNSKDEILT
ncbi:hypothetical protein [Shinella zoogloeoides]|uniref:hypothetical protein n=1 Tax=Shinella zoogloeoides TaxID=352475 RepID=UPI00273D0BDA|nr:hypothetical protein [Shinella zoogloeoides]WLR92389.1 hypothetical protein Q9316_18295 [Shinella zoogloeoides]